MRRLQKLIDLEESKAKLLPVLHNNRKSINLMPIDQSQLNMSLKRQSNDDYSGAQTLEKQKTIKVKTTNQRSMSVYGTPPIQHSTLKKDFKITRKKRYMRASQVVSEARNSISKLTDIYRINPMSQKSIDHELAKVYQSIDSRSIDILYPKVRVIEQVPIIQQVPVIEQMQQLFSNMLIKQSELSEQIATLKKEKSLIMENESRQNPLETISPSQEQAIQPNDLITTQVIEPPITEISLPQIKQPAAAASTTVSQTPSQNLYKNKNKFKVDAQQEVLYMPDIYYWCIIKNRRYDGLRQRPGFEGFADIEQVLQDAINVKAGFEELGADEMDIVIKEDVNFKGLKNILTSYRQKAQRNWDHGKRKTLIMFYYAGHGVMDNSTFVVCNPDKNDLTERVKFPLESSLQSLAKQPGTYVCSIFDCCREKISLEMRGGFNNPEEDAFDGDDYINSISWFGCAPNSGVAAESTIAVDFFKVLRRVANPRNGQVKLPHDMLTWHPGNGGNMLQQVKQPLLIAFDNWVPTEPINEQAEADADLEKAKAETIAAKDKTEAAIARVEALEKQKAEDDARLAKLEQAQLDQAMAFRQAEENLQQKKEEDEIRLAQLVQARLDQEIVLRKTKEQAKSMKRDREAQLDIKISIDQTIDKSVIPNTEELDQAKAKIVDAQAEINELKRRIDERDLQLQNSRLQGEALDRELQKEKEDKEARAQELAQALQEVEAKQQIEAQKEQKEQQREEKMLKVREQDHKEEEVPVFTTEHQPEIEDDQVLESQTQGFENEAVASALEKCGDYEYTDSKSLDMLANAGLTPEVRKTQILNDQIFKDGRNRRQIGKYTGEWVENSRHGKGKLVLQDGSIYEGFWLNDKKNGHGRQIFYNGCIYIGYWKDDCQHGTGTFTYATGMQYNGDWENDQKHGRGRENYKSGASYDGDFINNKRGGEGSYNYEYGDKYTGEWKDHEKHGSGVFKSWDGWEYRGQYVQGLKEGHGVSEAPDGRKYDGGWLQGERHGRGTQTDEKGVVKVGNWESGVRKEWISTAQTVQEEDEEEEKQEQEDEQDEEQDEDLDQDEEKPKTIQVDTRMVNARPFISYWFRLVKFDTKRLNEEYNGSSLSFVQTLRNFAQDIGYAKFLQECRKIISVTEMAYFYKNALQNQDDLEKFFNDVVQTPTYESVLYYAIYFSAWTYSEVQQEQRVFSKFDQIITQCTLESANKSNGQGTLLQSTLQDIVRAIHFDVWMKILNKGLKINRNIYILEEKHVNSIVFVPNLDNMEARHHLDQLIQYSGLKYTTFYDFQKGLKVKPTLNSILQKDGVELTQQISLQTSQNQNTIEERKGEIEAEKTFEEERKKNDSSSRVIKTGVPPQGVSIRFFLYEIGRKLDRTVDSMDQIVEKFREESMNLTSDLQQLPNLEEFCANKNIPVDLVTKIKEALEFHKSFEAKEIDGGYYWGQVKDGKPNGQGFVTYKNQRRKKKKVYVGYWQNGRKQGEGAQYAPNGTVVIGEWNENGSNDLSRFTRIDKYNKVTVKEESKESNTSAKVVEASSPPQGVSIKICLYEIGRELDRTMASMDPIVEKFSEESMILTSDLQQLPNLEEFCANKNIPVDLVTKIKEALEFQKSFQAMETSDGYFWGQVQDGKPNGQGFLTYKGQWLKEYNYEVFIGNWQNGKQQGKGADYLLDGRVQIGQYDYSVWKGLHIIFDKQGNKSTYDYTGK